jgi:hypothetical protein
LYIHKLQLQLNVEPAYYDDIIIDNVDKNEAIQPRNRAKLREEQVDVTCVNYSYFEYLC